MFDSEKKSAPHGRGNRQPMHGLHGPALRHTSPSANHVAGSRNPASPTPLVAALGQRGRDVAQPMLDSHHAQGLTPPHHMFDTAAVVHLLPLTSSAIQSQAEHPER